MIFLCILCYAHQGEDALDLSELEDGTLIAWVGEERPDALEAIYDRYVDLVYSLAMRMHGERESAREIVRQVFTQLPRDARSFDPRRETLVSRLLSLAHRLGIEELRRRPARLKDADGAAAADLTEGVVEGARSAADTWIGLRRSRVLDALQLLSVKQRQAVELAYFRGFTQEEIAALTGEPLNTIKSRLRLSLRKLREVLHQEDVEVRRS